MFQVLRLFAKVPVPNRLRGLWLLDRRDHSGFDRRCEDGGMAAATGIDRRHGDRRTRTNGKVPA